MVCDEKSRKLSAVIKQNPKTDTAGSPGLEKRETLRQAQGRLWGTPGFSPCQRLRATRVIPAREKGPTRRKTHVRKNIPHCFFRPHGTLPSHSHVTQSKGHRVSPM